MFRPMSLSRMATPALLMAAIIGCPAGAVGLQPLTSAFTYQGELGSAGAPASGTYDIRFRLYDAVTGGVQIGGTVCSDNLAVEAGRFSASLDFGAVFTGQKRFLEIEVRADTGLGCGDESGYTVLSPRQELTAVPNANFAQTAGTALAAQTAGNATSLGGQPASFFTNAANLTGTLPSNLLSGSYTGPLTLSNPANVFGGDGSGLTNLAAGSLIGTLDATRMPSNWAAGGDLRGVYPSPTIAPGAVTLNKLAPSVRGVLSGLSSLAPAPTYLDAVGFGANNRGQSGVPALPAGVTYAALAGGGSHSTALRSNGTVVSWGESTFGQTVVPALPAGVTYRAVAAGNIHSLALRSDGAVSAWGGNFNGQLNVPGLPGGVVYTAVACGRSHSYALRSDGVIAAWGDSSFNQLNVPTPPAGVTYTGVASGENFGLGLRSDGTVVTWGTSTNGQLNVPALPAGVIYTAVAGGATHCLALRSDGLIAAWGSNTNGQLNVPELPAGVTYTAVVSGYLHSLALRSDGVLVAFGINLDGQCNVPALAPGVIYTAIGSGPSAYHSLAVRSNTFAPSIGTALGLSVGSTTPPPANGGISVAGASSFAAGVSASLFTGSGAGLTNLNASTITSGTLANARTTGTNLGTPGTLVLRDGAGNFSAGTITAALNGNAATAGNATQLGGQPASFYTNATNLNAGTLPDARLSGNVPRLNANNSFSGTASSFAGRVGVNTPAGALELDVNGRINVASGVIQKDLSAGVVTGTTDLGLYSQIAGGWVRFVTNNAQFAWFSDSGAGTTPRMVLSPTGNLTVSGSLAKAGGSFKIDHPLDPENKYLYHSFVESPDMMNIYNGNVTTDGQGLATVTLPEYFEALNREFRYQLTVVDGESFAMVRVSRKISGNTFQIASSVPGVEVSWQVTGIRKDAWAEKNRIPNTVEKPAGEKGTLLHPEAFGRPATAPSRGGAAEAGPVGR